MRRLRYVGVARIAETVTGTDRGPKPNSQFVELSLSCGRSKSVCLSARMSCIFEHFLMDDIGGRYR